MNINDVKKYVNVKTLRKANNVIWDVAWTAVSISFAVGVFKLFIPIGKHKTDICVQKADTSYKYSYADAIEAISNSNMLTGDKIESMKVVPKNINDEMCRAIIEIVESNMLTNDKYEAIKALSQ